MLQNQGQSQGLLLETQRSLDTAQLCQGLGKLTCVSHMARCCRCEIVSGTYLAQEYS